MNYILVLVLTLGLSFSVSAAEVKGKQIAAATELRHEVVTPGATAVVEEAVKAQKTEGVMGYFEFRPTYNIKDNSSGSENTIALGYRFSPDFALEWTQYFGASFDDSFLLAKMKELWASDSGLKLTFEPRLYLPTNRDEAINGFKTALRGGFTLSQKLGQSVTLSVSEIPIVYWYSRDGGMRNEEPSANPIVSNNVYLVAEFDLGKGFALTVPLYLYMKYTRPYADDAKTSNRWVYKVHFCPELAYSLSENLRAGVAFRTDWFTNDRLEDWHTARAFRQGSGQVFVSATL